MRRHEVRHHVHTRRSDERHLGRTWEDGRWGGGGERRIESWNRKLGTRAGEKVDFWNFLAGSQKSAKNPGVFILLNSPYPPCLSCR